MLNLTIPWATLFPRQIAPELKTSKQSIQTPHDLAWALIDDIATPHRIYLDKPDSDVREHQAEAMLNAIATWMEDSPGLRCEVRLALVALTERMKPEFDGKRLLGRMREIIDTYKPEKFNTLEPYGAENIATFLQQGERLALYSQNRATANKLKYTRAHDLARTAKDAVSSADKLGRWLSSVEHLDDRRCHAQLLGVAAIASNAADYDAGVEDMLRAALAKLGHDEKDQITGSAYFDSVSRAIAQKSAVADWEDQWELAHQLDADFQSQPFAWLTAPVPGPRTDMNMHVRRIDAAILQLNHLPAWQLPEAINALFFALQHFEGDTDIGSRITVLEKAYNDLPSHCRASALPGYAKTIVLAAKLPRQETNFAWATRASPKFFDDVLDLASAEKSEDNLVRILDGLTVSMALMDDRSEQKVASILTLSTKLSSTNRANLLVQVSEFLFDAGKTSFFEICFKAYVDELGRTPVEAAGELEPVMLYFAQFLCKLNESQQEILYSKVPSFPPFVKTQLFRRCFLACSLISAPMLRLMMRHLWELTPTNREWIVHGLILYSELDEYGIFRASHDFLDYFSELSKEVQPKASRQIALLLGSKMHPTPREAEERLNLCLLIAEYLAGRPEAAPSFDAFAFGILEGTGTGCFGLAYGSKLFDVLSAAYKRIPKNRRHEYRFKP